MPWTITSPIIIWAVTTIILMAVMWFKQPDNKLTGLLFALDFVLYYIFWVESINWVTIIYWIWLIPIPFIIVLMVHYRRRFDRPSWVGKVPWLPGKSLVSRITLGIAIVITLIVGYVDFRVIRSFDYKSAPGDPLLLWFPSRYGAYVIANGGNAMDGFGLSTYYRGWFGSNGDEMEAYAVDVVKLWNLRGSMSNGILPSWIWNYKIYDDPVLTPCMGTIVYIEDGHEDLKPFEHPQSELGNYMVLQCAQAFVTLGNLRNGSINTNLKPGDLVDWNTVLAHVGNSGTPSIPHLHIRATADGWRPGTGTPLPMLFDGAYAINQFATRNKIFVP
jgi:heme/copper-type cytochrome/quinol oxidase subunit 2